jgi:hypothetical protein
VSAKPYGRKMAASINVHAAVAAAMPIAKHKAELTETSGRRITQRTPCKKDRITVRTPALL